MQQYIIHLNGGFNPFARLGRGALGYRPNRKMIGRSSNQVIPTTNDNQLVTNVEDNENNEDEEEEEEEEEEPYIPDIGVDRYINLEQDEFNKYYDNSNIGIAYRNKMVNKASNKLLKHYNTIITSNELSKSQVKKYTDFIRGVVVKNIILNYKKVNINDYPFLTPSDHLNIIINLLEDNITHGETYYLMNKDIDIYKDTITSLLTLRNDLTPDDKNRCDEAIASYVLKLNELSSKHTYKIQNYELKESAIIPETPDTNKYTKNLQMTDAENLITNYWNDTPTAVLNIETSSSSINDLIAEINAINVDDNDLIGVEINEDANLAPYIALQEQFPDKNLSINYMKTIVVKNKHIFLKSNGNIDNNKIDKEYTAAGKPSEFSICGIDNKFAKSFYNVLNPKFQISDFIVENITGKSGKSFCIDNIDIDNKIFNEMKQYNTVNYIRSCNLNRGLKKIYINDLKIKIDGYITQYNESTNGAEQEKLKKKITKIHDILIDKRKFDSSFYKNRKYIGIGVTMNKFDTIDFPTDYNYNKKSSNTKEMIDDVKSAQGRKFIPIFDDNRRITHVIYKTKDKVKNTIFNNGFNDILQGESHPYHYYVTCVFKNVIGVYDYTNDELLNKNLILESYKCAYAHDNAKAYNAVLIPIEKFIIKKFNI